jgi:hypothetical protein
MGQRIPLQATGQSAQTEEEKLENIHRAAMETDTYRICCRFVRQILTDDAN